MKSEADNSSFGKTVRTSFGNIGPSAATVLQTLLEKRFSPTAECFGVSAHIAFGVLRGTARPCRLVSPVPGTRVPRTGSGNQGSGQGSGNPGFREPGFGARFQEPKVPQTRLSSKVLGTMGSGYLLGSGTSRFREGSGHTWLSTRFREPYHGFERFWNHRNTNFETSWKPRVWGTRVPARF